MTRILDIRPGFYRDSVTLMQLSQRLLADAAVTHAQVSMGTDLNLDLLVEEGYERPEASAGDLVVAFVADDGTEERLSALVDELLAAAGPGVSDGLPASAPVRSLRTAAARGASVALISVPGEHATRVALEAVEAGAHPVVFSDNVSVADEILLKQRATDAGLLAMGPDCGTVVLDGVGLGFANVVTPGPIGLVSASGTGAQQVCALADHAGVGVRHVLGVGGRDLSDDVGGLAALAALRLLDDDPAVEVIGLVAKTIGPQTASALDAATAELATPTVTVALDDLTGGTAALVAAVGATLPEPTTWSPSVDRPRRAGRVLGLYGGGTLAAEAELVLAAAGVEAEILDLGDDEYTRGRPHPMIDSRLRIEHLEAAATDDGVAAVLLDVVLGHGAAADPAGDLAPALGQLPMPVHVALIGTIDDPQGRDRQAVALAEAGATVYLSNATAARAAGAS